MAYSPLFPRKEAVDSNSDEFKTHWADLPGNLKGHSVVYLSASDPVSVPGQGIFKGEDFKSMVRCHPDKGKIDVNPLTPRGDHREIVVSKKNQDPLDTSIKGHLITFWMGSVPWCILAKKTAKKWREKTIQKKGDGSVPDAGVKPSATLTAEQEEKLEEQMFEPRGVSEVEEEPTYLAMIMPETAAGKAATGVTLTAVLGWGLCAWLFHKATTEWYQIWKGDFWKGITKGWYKNTSRTCSWLVGSVRESLWPSKPWYQFWRRRRLAESTMPLFRRSKPRRLNSTERVLGRLLNEIHGNRRF